MSTDRWVVLGLAPARAEWFRDMARWSSSAALPVEFVKCVSADEVRIRLRSGRPWSALLVDAALPDLDRDLVADAAEAGTPVLAVQSGRSAGWDPLGIGAAGVLPEVFGRDDLLDALAALGGRVTRGDHLPSPLAPAATGGWRGALVAVCGAGGTGASTVAIGIAQGFAADARYAGGVLLADLALRGDHAMLHDAGELGPGLQELVDSHRVGRPEPETVASHTFDVPARGYRLLLGLRSPSAWTALRPRAIDETIDGLRRTFRLVVADVTGDVEGEADSGSMEVEERNHLARSTVAAANAVLAVGNPGLKGIHSLGWLVRSLSSAGVEPARLLPVVNRAPRDPRARAELAAALARVAPDTSAVGAPIWARERKIEPCLRDGTPLPAGLIDPLTAAVAATLERLPPRSGSVGAADPQPVAPGSLGVWEGDDPT